jgi:flagellar basal-body rod protein FlgB
MRADGNNVDLDVEKVNQAANTLMYNALVTQANSKLSASKYVITGGGN